MFFIVFTNDLKLHAISETLCDYLILFTTVKLGVKKIPCI